MLSSYFSVALRLFFLLTPFFAMTVFLSLTSDMDRHEQHKIVWRTSVSNLLICYFVYFFGEFFFSIFGITLDAFRIGAGLILFFSAINLLNGRVKMPETDNADISVVPLSIPVTIGPGTIGALLLMGSDSKEGGVELIKIIDCMGILTGIFLLGLILYFSRYLEKIMGRRNISIMSKLTGLVLATLAMQMVFTGAANFLDIAGALAGALQAK